MASCLHGAFPAGKDWGSFVEEHLQQLRSQAQSITSEFELGPIHERLKEISLEKHRARGKTYSKTEELQFKLQLTTTYHQVFLEILTSKKLFQNKCKREFKSCFENYNLESRNIIKEQFICNEKRDPTPDLYRLSQKVLSQFDKALGQVSETNKIETAVRDEYRRRLAKKMGDKLVSFNEKPAKTVNIHRSVWNYKRAAAIAILVFTSIVLISGAFVFLHSNMIPTANQPTHNVTEATHDQNLPSVEKIELRLTGNFTEDMKTIEIYINNLTTDFESFKKETRANVATRIDNKINAFEFRTQNMQVQLVSQVLPRLHYLNFQAQLFEIESEQFHKETMKIFNMSAFKTFEANLTTELDIARYKTEEVHKNWISKIGEARTKVQKFYAAETTSVHTGKELLPRGLSLELHNNASLMAISTCARAKLIPTHPRFLMDLKLSLDNSFLMKFTENIYIGIDFGTKYIRAAVYIDGKVQIIPHFADSGEIYDYLAGYVGVDDDEQYYVGQKAEKVITEYHNTFQPIFYEMKTVLQNGAKSNAEFLLTFFPSTDGKHVTLKGKKTQYSVEDIISKLFNKTRENAGQYLGGPVKKCVITIFPNLSEINKTIIFNAGKSAGFTDVKLLNESEAAGIALQNLINVDYRVGEKVLIIQLGARYWGTSILRGNENDTITEISPWSWTKGGFELINNLVDYCINEFCKKEKFDKNKLANDEKGRIFKRRLFEICEKAAIELTTKIETEIKVPKFYNGKDLRIKITRGKFYEVVKLESEIENVLRSTKPSVSRNSIYSIILSGGYSRHSRVQDKVRNYFDGRNVTVAFEKPEEIVVYGAAVKGAKLAA